MKWEEARQQIQKQFGDSMDILGQLEFHTDDKLVGEWFGLLPFRLASAISKPLLDQYAIDLHSQESVEMLNKGKFITYFVYAPQQLLFKALDAFTKANATSVNGIPVLNLPLGVYEEPVDPSQLVIN